jgi:hypothetical protein
MSAVNKNPHPFQSQAMDQILKGLGGLEHCKTKEISDLDDRIVKLIDDKQFKNHVTILTILHKKLTNYNKEPNPGNLERIKKICVFINQIANNAPKIHQIAASATQKKANIENSIAYAIQALRKNPNNPALMQIKQFVQKVVANGSISSSKANGYFSDLKKIEIELLINTFKITGDKKLLIDAQNLIRQGHLDGLLTAREVNANRSKLIRFEISQLLASKHPNPAKILELSNKIADANDLMAEHDANYYFDQFDRVLSVNDPLKNLLKAQHLILKVERMIEKEEPLALAKEHPEELLKAAHEELQAAQKKLVELESSKKDVEVSQKLKEKIVSLKNYLNDALQAIPDKKREDESAIKKSHDSYSIRPKLDSVAESDSESDAS